MGVSVKTFRIISVLEAVSFLLLLGIAMPLKYIWGSPEMVRIVGAAHGVLFLAYFFGAFLMKAKLKWPLKTLAVVLLCALLPFGPFYADAKYLR